MPRLPKPPVPPELTPERRALNDYVWLHNQLAGEIREAAGAAGLSWAERRRRLQQLLYALPDEAFMPTIDQLLEAGKAGPLDEAVGTGAANAAHRQLAAIGSVWRLSHAGQLAPVDADVVECWRPGDQEHDHAMCQDVAAEEAEAQLTEEERAQRRRARQELRMAAVAVVAPEFVRPAPAWPDVEQVLNGVPLVGEDAAALLRPVMPPPIMDPALRAAPAEQLGDYAGEPVTRARMFAALASAVALGLPAPESTYMYVFEPGRCSLDLTFEADDRAAVDAWAAWLQLNEQRPLRPGQQVRSYQREDRGEMSARWLGWPVTVYCLLSTPDCGPPLPEPETASPDDPDRDMGELSRTAAAFDEGAAPGSGVSA